MSADEYAGGPGMDFATWIEETGTPAGQARAQQLADDDATVAEFLAYEQWCRDHAAVAAWLASPEARAGQARLLALSNAGPERPAEPTEPADRYEGTNSTPQAGSGAHRPGTGHYVSDGSADQRGRWRRWWGV